MNKLVLFLSLDDLTQRDVTIHNPFYKDITFDRVYLVGRFTDKVNDILKIKRSKDFKRVDLTENFDKLFLFKRNKESKEISEKPDPYKPPYDLCIFNPLVEEELMSSKVSKEDTIYYTAEKNSWFDLHLNTYQFSSLIKPRTLNSNLYIKEKVIDSFSAFENSLFFEGLDIIKCYITAEFHINDQTQNIPGWAISPNTPWISLILSSYNVRPLTVDNTFYQEFLAIGKIRSTFFYLSINEMMKRFEDQLDVDDDDYDRDLSEKEQTFIDKYFDPVLFKYVFEENTKKFLKWTDPDVYDQIREILLKN